MPLRDGRGRGGGGGLDTAAPRKVFLHFFQDNFSSAPTVISSCMHIP